MDKEDNMGKEVTEEDICKFEDLLREAQARVEEAGRIMCKAPGDTVGGRLWRNCTGMSESIGDLIHQAFRANDTDPWVV